MPFQIDLTTFVPHEPIIKNYGGFKCIGKRFGMLTVVASIGKVTRGGVSVHVMRALCDCGGTKETLAECLSAVASCGCQRKPSAESSFLRFMKSVTKGDGPDDCWLWTGRTDKDGYAGFWFSGTNVRGHRYSYEWFRGPIPTGLQIDHLCRVRNCVNPSHLEPVTCAVNIARGNTGDINSAKTTCPNNHPYDMIDRDGARGCRTCLSALRRKYRKQRYVPTGTRNSSKTACPKGHPYDLITEKARICRTCRRLHENVRNQ
jgi:hypothetical protein